jgi:hypothetical protein
MNGRDLKHLTLGAVLMVSGLSVLAAVNLPHTFQAGTTIKANEVNANFAALNTGKQDRVNAVCSPGSSIRTINENGTVECETDDSNAGGGLTKVTVNPGYFNGDGTPANPLELKFGLAVEGAWGPPFGAMYLGNTDGGFGIHGANVRVVDGGSSPGIKGSSKSTSPNATGVLGVVEATTGGSNSVGVYGINNSNADFTFGTSGILKAQNSGVGSAGVIGSNEATDNDGVGVAGYHSGGGQGVYGFASKGTGVFGAASEPGSTGVMAKNPSKDSSSAALKIEGQIAVSGPVDNRAAFIHKATEKAVCTTLSTVTDLDALVFATHNFNQSGNGGLSLNAPFEAVYGNGTWAICTTDKSIIFGQAFNVLVIHANVPR